MKFCTVEGCQKPLRSSGAIYCKMHYHRMYRHGSLEPLRAKRAKRGICTMEGCNKVDVGSHGLCDMHYARFTRHGDPSICIAQKDRAMQMGEDHHAWGGDNVSYGAVHSRIRTRNGPARTHACVDCGKQARHWSYDHLDPEERHEKMGRYVVAYSTKLEHYAPRCVRCHKLMDLAIKGR